MVAPTTAVEHDASVDPLPPDELARVRALAQLLGEEASYCTGTVLDVAGGR